MTKILDWLDDWLNHPDATKRLFRVFLLMTLGVPAIALSFYGLLVLLYSISLILLWSVAGILFGLCLLWAIRD